MSEAAPRGNCNNSSNSTGTRNGAFQYHHTSRNCDTRNYSARQHHEWQTDSGLEIHSELEAEATTTNTNTTSLPCALTKSSSLASLNQRTPIQPRMAQLESLEAKMASIEVSLSSSPRRKKNNSLNGSVRALPKDVTMKELESLRNALKDKENIIQTLKGQLSIPAIVRLNHNMRNHKNGIRELSDTEKKQAEERLARLRNDTDAKRLAIKNLKMALERLDITDNIDVRIQQAELEYQLGREELNLLTLLEETRALQHCLEEANKKANEMQTLYSCFSVNEDLSIHMTDIVYDPKNPRFGAGRCDNRPGLYVDWALEDTGLQKDDRLIEVNGKLTLTVTTEDLMRLLQVAPDPATLVVLRKGSCGKIPIIPTNHTREINSLKCELDIIKERAEEAQRAKDSLRSDNIRLTHRISYLEEQVSELLSRKSDSDIRVLTQSPLITSTVKTSKNVTNINISSQPTILQNDNHPGVPLRSKSSLSNVSNTIIMASSPQPTSDHLCSDKPHRHNKHRSRSGLLLAAANSHKLDSKKYYHHHHHHRERDYSSETNSAIDYLGSRQSIDNMSTGKPVERSSNSNIMDQSYRKATKIVHDLTKHSGHLFEKNKSASTKCIGNSEKYNSDVLKYSNTRKSTSVLDFRSEIHLGPKYTSDSCGHDDVDGVNYPYSKKDSNNSRRLYKKLQDTRSIKSLDCDNDKHGECPTETIIKPRPVPPKKPLRLSLHRAQSLQSVETPVETLNDANDNRKAMKRNHKGEAPKFMLSKGTNHQGKSLTSELTNGVSYKNQTKPQSPCNEVKWTSFAKSSQKNNIHDLHEFVDFKENKHWC